MKKFISLLITILTPVLLVMWCFLVVDFFDDELTWSKFIAVIIYSILWYFLYRKHRNLNKIQ